MKIAALLAGIVLVLVILGVATYRTDSSTACIRCGTVRRTTRYAFRAPREETWGNVADWYARRIGTPHEHEWVGCGHGQTGGNLFWSWGCACRPDPLVDQTISIRLALDTLEKVDLDRDLFSQVTHSDELYRKHAVSLANWISLRAEATDAQLKEWWQAARGYLNSEARYLSSFEEYMSKKAADAQEAFEGTVTIGADGRAGDLKVDSKQPLEGRVWIKGTVNKGVVTVADFEPLPPKWDAKAEGKSFSAALTEVYAWCDHMPVIGDAKNPRRQHLKLSVTLKNKTDKPLEVKVARAFLSFDEKAEGAAAALTGSVTLQANEEKALSLRGDGLYEEGNHAKTLHVALIFAAGDERLGVRAGGPVNETY